MAPPSSAARWDAKGWSACRWCCTPRPRRRRRSARARAAASGAPPAGTRGRVAGGAFRVDAAIVLEEFEKRGALYTILTRYIHTIFVVASQSTACNRRHLVEARLARWLLTSSDGIGSHSVGITQEFL